MIDSKKTRYLKRRSYLHGCVTIGVTPVLIYIYMIEDNFELKLVRMLPVVVSLFLQFGLVFQVSQYMTLIGLSYTAFTSHVKKYFDQNKLRSVQSLKRLRDFISMINLNIKLINVFLDPSISIWTLKLVAILILNTYLGIIQFDQIWGIEMMMSHMRTLLAIMVIIYLIYRLELLGRQVRL